jgi:hypothetical protein
MMEEQKKLGLEEGGGGCSNGREKVIIFIEFYRLINLQTMTHN